MSTEFKFNDRQDRRYKFSYIDKEDNELYFTYHWFPTLTYAKLFAKKLEANSRLGSLHRIKVTTAFK